MTVYLVTGTHRFQGFGPGETFVGKLEHELEARALQRGNIQILERGEIALDPARVTMPAGWASPHERSTAR